MYNSERAEALLRAFAGPKELYGLWKSFLAYCITQGVVLAITLVLTMPKGRILEFLHTCKFNPEPEAVDRILT
jgi:hypothetical protein